MILVIDAPRTLRIPISLVLCSAVKEAKPYRPRQLMKTVNEEPYTWTLQKGLPLQIQYTVKVVAYDNDGKNSTDEITIWKFF